MGDQYDLNRQRVICLVRNLSSGNEVNGERLSPFSFAMEA